MPEPIHVVSGMEVLDTVVKIGLGAFISGLATYWVTKLNHDKELEKQTIRRRRELLEHIATGVEKFWNEYRRYYLVSLEAIHRARKHDVILSIVDEYESRKQKVLETTNDLGIAQSNLLLLGEEKVTDTLNALAISTESYMRATGDLNTDLPIDKLKDMYSDARKTRARLYAALSNIYK